MSVTRAIDEELAEIEERIKQLEWRRTRLLDARHLLNGTEVDSSTRAYRSAEEWREEILRAGAELGEFTVGEIAHEVDSDAPYLYRFFSQLEDEGRLVLLEKRSKRNARMYRVADG